MVGWLVATLLVVMQEAQLVVIQVARLVAWRVGLVLESRWW